MLAQEAVFRGIGDAPPSKIIHLNDEAHRTAHDAAPIKNAGVRRRTADPEMVA